MNQNIRHSTNRQSCAIHGPKICTDPLINTPLQRGDARPARPKNRFNGFGQIPETVETVSFRAATTFTPLKRGVNERVVFRGVARHGVFGIGAVLVCMAAVILVVATFATAAENAATRRVVFAGVKSGHNWPLKELNPEWPSDWSEYNYLVIEMKTSAPQRFALWVYTADGLGAGLVQTRDQIERGKGYRHYVEQAAALPGFLGTHWFTWRDEPVLGRGDGENYNIGFVDVTDRPYPELVKAAKATHGRLFKVHSGKTSPFAQRPKSSDVGTPSSPWTD